MMASLLPRKRLDHRQDAVRSSAADRARTRPGRFAADVEDRGTLIDRPQALRDRRLRLS